MAGDDLTIVLTIADTATLGGLHATLAEAARLGVRIVVRTRGSTESGTPLAQHPVAGLEGVRLCGAASLRALIEDLPDGYVTFLETPDRIDAKALVAAAQAAGPGRSIVTTPAVVDGEAIAMPHPEGPVAVSSASIAHILRDEGTLFGAAALRAARSGGGCEPLALPLLLEGRAEIHHVGVAFHHGTGPRPAGRPDPAEIRAVAARLEELVQLHGLDRGVFLALRQRLDAPPEAASARRAAIRRVLKEAAPLRLKRIVMLTRDSSTLGGIPGRTRTTMKHAQGRTIEYLNIAAQQSQARELPAHVAYSEARERVLGLLEDWSPAETVVFTPNNVLRTFDADFRARISRFPVVHMFSGQLAFMIQDQTLLAQLDYVRGYRASAILAFSDMDIAFQRQLGVYGQTKGWLPVETRPSNDYAAHSDRAVGYVGRIDFHAKAADRLLDLAELMDADGRPPVRVFTTSSRNSPDYSRFMVEIERRNLSRMFEITLDCEDKDRIFRSLSVLVLPSKKESFGQVVLEAFSYGVPVVAASYAPGPAELIVSGRNGMLLDDFSAEKVLGAIDAIQGGPLAEMSAAAFEEHRGYTMAGHLDLLEEVATATLSGFFGRNELRPFPELAIARAIASGRLAPPSLRAELSRAKARVRAYAKSRSWRAAALLRRLASVVRR